MRGRRSQRDLAVVCWLADRARNGVTYRNWQMCSVHRLSMP